MSFYWILGRREFKKIYCSRHENRKSKDLIDTLLLYYKKSGMLCAEKKNEKIHQEVKNIRIYVIKKF